jgi:16S rRNA (cytidine1402-2'-O)-methyltransferase
LRPIPEHPRAVSLLIVATPIGNLKDLSVRGLEALQNADYILCEDTRRAQKLKAHFGLKPRLVSLHEHNEKQRIPKIIRLMQQGKQFALISDAGTPLLSDPGSLLLRELIRLQLPFTFIPGPSAVIASLVLSGFETDRFVFYGFLPVSPADRKSSLERLATFTAETIVLFEAPHRIVGLLREIGEILGDRDVAVCRELTKLHEEVVRGKVSEILTQLSARKLLGEFTIAISPGPAHRVEMSLDSIRERFQQLQIEGYSRKDALKQLSKESGKSKNDLYQLLMK